MCTNGCLLPNCGDGIQQMNEPCDLAIVLQTVEVVLWGKGAR